MRKQLMEHLFSFSEHDVYAVIDAASVSGLVSALSKNNMDYCCLFSGKLSAALANNAPYLVKLKQRTPFIDWLIEAWGEHFGIIAIIPNAKSFNEVRKHFRSLLMVKAPEKKTLYFRYYDPRVLRSFLPLCVEDQVKEIFNQIKLFILEGEEKTSVMRYWVDTNKVKYHKSTYLPS